MSKLQRQVDAIELVQQLLEALRKAGTGDEEIARYLDVDRRTLRRARAGATVLRFDTLLGLQELVARKITVARGKARILDAARDGE